MTRATELSEALELRLEAIKQAAGFHTQLAGVYGFGKIKPDAAPLPFLLVRVTSDDPERLMGNKAQRAVTYQIEGVMPRASSLQDLQRLQHDILKTIGVDPLPMVRPLESGWLFEESTEFDPENDGSRFRTVVVSVTLRYIETY
jgi:hypothetical protein